MQMALIKTELVSPTSFCGQPYQWNGNIVSFDLMSKWHPSMIESSHWLTKLVHIIFVKSQMNHTWYAGKGKYWEKG